MYKRYINDIIEIARIKKDVNKEELEAAMMGGKMHIAFTVKPGETGVALDLKFK